MIIRPNPGIEGMSGALTVVSDKIAAHADVFPDHYIDYKTIIGPSFGHRYGAYTADAVATGFGDQAPTITEEVAQSIADTLNREKMATAKRAIEFLHMAPTDYEEHHYLCSTPLTEEELVERWRMSVDHRLPKTGTGAWKQVTCHDVTNAVGSPSTVRLTSTSLKEPGWVDSAHRSSVETFTDIRREVSITELAHRIVDARVIYAPLEDGLTMRLRRRLRDRAYRERVEPVLRGAFENDRALAAHLMLARVAYEDALEGAINADTDTDTVDADIETVGIRARAMKEAIAPLSDDTRIAWIPSAALLRATDEQVHRLSTAMYS